MSIATKSDYTVAQYLEFERESELRHEFFQGEIREMTGASLRHTAIIRNMLFAIVSQLPKSQFWIGMTDVRVKVDEYGLYTYPDLVIVQGKPERETNLTETLLNPIVLIEVLSESTEKYDRGEKFKLYQGVPTFREYILVAQDHPEIDQFVQDTSGDWQRRGCDRLTGTLEFQSVSCAIPLTEIYDQIDFVPEA
jgi:Uma2 family endonuclease